MATPIYHMENQMRMEHERRLDMERRLMQDEMNYMKQQMVREQQMRPQYAFIEPNPVPAASPKPAFISNPTLLLTRSL